MEVDEQAKAFAGHAEIAEKLPFVDARTSTDSIRTVTFVCNDRIGTEDRQKLVLFDFGLGNFRGWREVIAAAEGDQVLQ